MHNSNNLGTVVTCNLMKLIIDHTPLSQIDPFVSMQQVKHDCSCISPSRIQSQSISTYSAPTSMLARGELPKCFPHGWPALGMGDEENQPANNESNLP